MPSEADRAAKAHEKKKAAERAELDKQLKLERRRSRICVAANTAVPRTDQAPVSPIESTGETPFKGRRSINPLEEKKRAEEYEEERLIQQLSDERDLNLSQAKVLLAHHPELAEQLRCPGHSRSASNASIQSKSPVSPTHVRRISNIPISPVGSQHSDAASNHKQKARAQVLSMAAPMLLADPPKRQTMTSMDTFELPSESPAEYTPPKRQLLPRMESTRSIDTTLISPQSTRFSDVILEDSMRSLGMYEDSPVSPTGSTFSGNTNYSASVYSPAVVQENNITDYMRIPRGMDGRVRFEDATPMTPKSQAQAIRN